MCSPPPRDKANQEVIWQGLVTGVFDVFSSDHAGYRYNDLEGKMKHGRNAPFKKVANGVPGLEVRTPLLFSEGVRQGTHRSPEVRGIDRNQRREALRTLSAQGHHCGRQRR